MPLIRTYKSRIRERSRLAGLMTAPNIHACLVVPNHTQVLGQNTSLGALTYAIIFSVPKILPISARYHSLKRSHNARNSTMLPLQLPYGPTDRLSPYLQQARWSLLGWRCRCILYARCLVVRRLISCADCRRVGRPVLGLILLWSLVLPITLGPW